MGDNAISRVEAFAELASETERVRAWLDQGSSIYDIPILSIRALVGVLDRLSPDLEEPK